MDAIEQAALPISVLQAQVSALTRRLDALESIKNPLDSGPGFKEKSSSDTQITLDDGSQDLVDAESIPLDTTLDRSLDTSPRFPTPKPPLSSHDLDKPSAQQTPFELQTEITAITRRLDALLQATLMPCRPDAGSVKSAESALASETLSSVAKGPSSPAEEPEKHADTMDILLEQGYILQGSMWDVALLIGTPPLGYAGSIFTSLLLVLNVIVQFCFIDIVQFVLVTNPYGTNTIEGYRLWRRNIAHSYMHMDDFTGVSMASRVCSSDQSLEWSTSQANAHEVLFKYLDSTKDETFFNFTGSRGMTMCMLTILVWLLCLSKEFHSIVAFSRAVSLVPKSEKTVILGKIDGWKTIGMGGDESGRSAIKSITPTRRGCCLGIQFIRLVVLGELGWYGTLWLVHTTNISDLVLNAVALEFILSIDELIFEVLCPKRTQKTLASFEDSPLPLPPARDWHGLSIYTASFFTTIFVILLVIYIELLIPFAVQLKQADDALCGGSLDFVYASGATGIPFWAETVHPESPSRVRKDSSWEAKDTILNLEKGLNFKSMFIDKAIGQLPDPNTTCGSHVKMPYSLEYWEYCPDVNANNTWDDDVWYDANDTHYNSTCMIPFCKLDKYPGYKDINGIVVHALTDRDRACCLLKQIRMDNVQGGAFSVGAEAQRTTADSMTYHNARCEDLMEPERESVDIFSNVMAGVFADALNENCGICPAPDSMCLDGKCTKASCAEHVLKYCHADSAAGVLARQYCPLTCGCADPGSKLLLSDPEMGCPESCSRISTFTDALATQKCKDVEISEDGNDMFTEYLDEFIQISENWPSFYKYFTEEFITSLRTAGCYGVYKLASKMEIDFCEWAGTPFPVKPVTYMCPEACNCFENNRHGCPTTCNTTSKYFPRDEN